MLPAIGFAGRARCQGVGPERVQGIEREHGVDRQVEVEVPTLLDSIQPASPSIRHPRPSTHGGLVEDNARIRVLIVDDHEVVRSSSRRVIATPSLPLAAAHTLAEPARD